MREGSLWGRLALDPGRDGPFGFVGGGGKTSGILQLAREARALGLRVLVAATTHMRVPASGRLCQSGPAVGRTLDARGIALAGMPCGDGRFGALPGLDRCAVLSDVALVEADGARMLPLKAPAEHEPALMSWMRCVVGVAGLDCLGRSIREACHRPEQVAALLGVGTGHILTEEDVAAVLASGRGARKDVGDRQYRCLLNKADTLAMRQSAERILGLLGEEGVVGAISSHPAEERDMECLF